jgi:DNA-binding XRE family transcriptional regulator
MNSLTAQNPIRLARKRAKLTQQALGKRVGVKKAAVCSWETGRYRPDAARGLQLVKLLPGLTMDQIYAAAPQNGKAA